MKDILSLEKAHKDYVSRPSELLGISASLAIIVKDTADKLEKLYPGWLWTLNPDEFAGMLYLYSLRLSGEYGYKMKIGDIENDETRGFAMRAGGELLERFGCPRKAFKPRYLADKIQDVRGNYIPDQTDKSQKAQKQDRDRVINAAVTEGIIEFRHVDQPQPDGSTRRQLFMKIGGDEDADADPAG